MFLGEGLFFFVALGFTIWALFDVITSDESEIQNLPKIVWILLVIFLGPIGSLAWLLLGRPRGASFQIRSPGPYRRQAPEPPPPTGLAERRMSDEDYQRRREEALQKHQAEREEELRRKEEELRRREDELRRREQGDA